MTDPIHFSLHDGKVQQRHPDGSQDWFDPEQSFGLFQRVGHPETVVRACKIPGRFRIGAEVCRDGYLVLAQGRLKAISAATFSLDYDPVGEERRAA